MLCENSVKKILLFFVAVFFCFNSGLICADEFDYENLSRGEVAFGVFFADPSGSTSYSLATAGTNLGYDSTLGYSEENVFFGRMKYFHKHRFPDISLNAYLFKYDADSSGSFTFGDQNFDDGTFNSELSAKAIDLSLYFPIKPISVAAFGKVKVNVGGALRWFDIEQKISESDLSVTKDANEYAASLYFDILYRPFRGLELAFEAKALPLTSTSFTNLTARISYNIFESVFASAGYMSDSVEIDTEGYKADLDTEGPFLELGWRF
jgi:hypothetical protein